MEQQTIVMTLCQLCDVPIVIAALTQGYTTDIPLNSWVVPPVEARPVITLGAKKIINGIYMKFMVYHKNGILLTYKLSLN